MREYNEVMNKFYDPEKCVFFENALPTFLEAMQSFRLFWIQEEILDGLYLHFLLMIIKDLEKNGKITNYR